MRSMIPVLSIVVFVVLVAFSHKTFQMASPDRFVSDVNESIEQQREALHEQQRQLSLRVNLLEYQNYLLLSIISDAGMREKIEKYSLSLYPPEQSAARGPSFDAVYQQYRHGQFLEYDLPSDEQKQPPMFSNEFRPPSVDHYSFREHWRAVSAIQQQLADVYRK